MNTYSKLRKLKMHKKFLPYQISGKKKGACGDYSSGSIRHALSINQVKALISNTEIVVCIFKNHVIGYYLTNSLFPSENLKRRKEIMERLITEKKYHLANIYFKCRQQFTKII